MCAFSQITEITDVVWGWKVDDELHWNICKRFGTMEEWNKAIEHFNNHHNENGFCDTFTDDNHTVKKIRLVETDDEDDVYCREMNENDSHHFC